MDKVKYPGLTQNQALKKLKTDGFNELASQKRQSLFITIINVVKQPMLLLLIGSGTIYLILGEARDALMLLTFVFVVIGITIYQERKTSRALEALKNLSSPRASVIRDGEQIKIPGREVVVDDILVLREGDRVAADAVVLEAVNLSVDESLLTGESLPVRKAEWDGKMDKKRPGGEDLPFVYSGTLVVAGHGLVRVNSTGASTEMGRIGKALESVKEEDTLLEKETARIVKKFAIAGLFLCALIIVVYGLTRGNWLEGFLAGLTLSMAMLPEEFSVILIIFLALGAWRISKRQVLTRRTAAIETLGAATVFCVDKTGTLTLNRMQLTTMYCKEKFFEVKKGVINSDGILPASPAGGSASAEASRMTNPLPEDFHSLIEYSILASQKDPFDPIEKEVKKIGDATLSNTEHIHRNWSLIKEYPLSKHLLALSHVWTSPDKKSYVIAAKGAPEAIIDLCHLSDIKVANILDKVSEMSARGLRVLGVAKANFNKTNLPGKQHDFDFEFVGLLGFVDPVRANVADAVKESYQAGIRLIMITGDYPGTACHIARQIGLRNPAQFITGSQLEKMDHLELREKIKSVNIFARVVPEQKLAIVNALKANGEIVAMTGDGVNDAPALKSAHIGIAMGERGTDVAREASALVLLNDDFSSIVAAVRLGRRIFDNLKKAMAYVLAVHVPIAGMSLLPVLFKLPVVLLPAHIAFLELIIDPACSVVFEAEPEEQDVMKRPPRNLNEPLINIKTLALSLLQGFSVLAIVFIVFLLVLYQGKGDLEARTISFTALVFANILLIIFNLSWKQNFIRVIKNGNKALPGVVGGALLALILVLYLPFLQKLFHFTFLHGSDLLLGIGGAIVSLVWFEGLKVVNNRVMK